jgi:hypothetical protein
MSLRQYFAGQALSNPLLMADSKGWTEHTVAKAAYIIADAMLKEN